jgi:hypothetical protein
MASALPDIAKNYGVMHGTGCSGLMILTCYFVARYHEFCNFVHDALNFLSLICAWATIRRTIIRNLWSSMGKLSL